MEIRQLALMRKALGNKSLKRKADGSEDGAESDLDQGGMGGEAKVKRVRVGTGDPS